MKNGRNRGVTPEESVLEVWRKVRQALLERDGDALELWIAGDYRGYGPGGELQDKEMTLQAYGVDGVQLETYEVDDMKVDVVGEIGIITGRAVIRGMWQMEAFDHDLRFLDVYVQRSGRWQLWISQVTEMEDSQG